ncbi:hypothetical protein F5Y17DRAFT_459311 [Xylariaceae sp. FL0594]|nr:hypothetical protein F5Y17DRAFT_459311 [Xylariaceae sp. FL0594]
MTSVPERDMDRDPEDHTNLPISSCFGTNPFSFAPVEIGPTGPGSGNFAAAGKSKAFTTWPLLGPLLFENDGSDARDHCANERTFLSNLRLSVYMSIVSVAISLSFHLRNPATPLERRLAMPLGLVFWSLSVACLTAGLGNYVKTVNKYGRRAAIVQSGWRTQSIMAFIAFSIIGTCLTMLVIDSGRYR